MNSITARGVILTIGSRNASDPGLGRRGVLLTLLVVFLLLQPLSGATPRSRSKLSDPTEDFSDHASAGMVLPPLPGGALHVLVPILATAPMLKDFLPDSPTSNVVRRMLRITNFVERSPDDGSPATEPTVAYLGYTHEDMYVAFVCKDDDTRAIRAHLLQRDWLSDDDFVQVMLDTFHDSRRAFVFNANALGIQADALYTEQTGADYSFDTVWDTWGRRIPGGYAVLMRIPFASLRFDNVPAGAPRTWGIILRRTITRKNESVYWPQVKHNVAGQLTQEAVADGFQNIERGKTGSLSRMGWRTATGN